MLWKPSMMSSEWFEMNDKPAMKVSLKPKGMEPLSSINKTIETKVIDSAPQNNSNNQQSLWSDDDIKAKQKDIQKSVSDRVPVNFILEQDNMEGVDDSEWQEQE